MPHRLFFSLLVLGVTVASGCGLRGGRDHTPVDLRGIGASFPAALYARWQEEYRARRANVTVSYEPSSSGAGKTAIFEETADFGASDAAMTEEEMARVRRGVVVLPLTAGNVVLAYNLVGVTDLKLSREAYVGIFLGSVKQWDDPLIVRSNPGARLPNLPIQVTVRSDSSGTSFAFSTHLSAISPDFSARVGVSTQPTWPVGAPYRGAKGVADHIRATPGAIGCLEQGRASALKLPSALLENRSGAFVRPTTAAAQSALASVDLFEDLIGWVPDPTPADAYPIVTFTWLICYKEYDATKAEALKDFLSYCLEEGQQQAEALGYVPLPPKVVRRVRGLVKQVHGR